MPEGGTLTITTRNVILTQEVSENSAAKVRPGSYIQVSIADTGEGIPAGIREKIFDPFFTTKEVGAGTGLGLAGVYSTVQEHHGAISVTSEVRRGTTFHLLFPITADIPAEKMRARRPLPRGVGTILFADMSVCSPMFCPYEGQVISDVATAVTTAKKGGFLYAQVGLDYGPEEYHGTLTGLKAS
jgi:hypothetical protein